MNYTDRNKVFVFTLIVVAGNLLLLAVGKRSLSQFVSSIYYVVIFVAG